MSSTVGEDATLALSKQGDGKEAPVGGAPDHAEAVMRRRWFALQRAVATLPMGRR